MKKTIFYFSIFAIFFVNSLNAGEKDVKKYEIGIATGILFSSDVYISLYGDFVKQKSNFLIKSYFDYFLFPQLSFGFYVNYSTINLVEDIRVFGKEIKKSGTPILEFGGSVKPKFELSPLFILKPGFSIGHRQYFGDEDFSTWKGLALNGSCEIQYLISQQYKVFAELGFLYQPYGGNIDTDVTFDPTPYFIIGIVF